MFLNGFGASQDNNEAAFTEAARRIYGDPNVTLAQAQQMIVQAFYDTGVSMEFAAMTFDMPVSDVQTVIDRYVNTVVFSPPVQAPTQAELRAAAQAAEAARQAQAAEAARQAQAAEAARQAQQAPTQDEIRAAYQAAEAARQAQQAIENAKNSSNPVFDPSDNSPVQTGTTGASPALLLAAIAASLLLGG